MSNSVDLCLSVCIKGEKKKEERKEGSQMHLFKSARLAKLSPKEEKKKRKGKRRERRRERARPKMKIGPKLVVVVVVVDTKFMHGPGNPHHRW